MDIIARIKNLCDEKGITLAALERHLDMGSGTIRRWNTASPTSDKLLKVANYFNVSLDFLTGITDTPMRTEETLKLEGVYLNFAKTAQDNGIEPEDIQLAIDTIKKLRGEK